jgi:twitching motility two-component system response regulator PilG
MGGLAGRKRGTDMSKLVMVIDDSPTVRKIVETSLRREGFTVQSYADGIEAIKALTQKDAHIPDLVLLDIGLPKMDGYEVARYLKVKQEFNKTVIIMLSRRDGVIDKLKGKLAGAKDYITKPFKTQDIISITESYLGVPAQSQF